MSEHEEELSSPYNRWNILSNKIQVDFYDIINLLESNGRSIPTEISHALKKLMYVGERGHKDLIKDMEESIWSIERFIGNQEARMEFVEEETEEEDDNDYSDIYDDKPENHYQTLREEDVKKAIENGYAYTRSLEKVKIQQAFLKPDTYALHYYDGVFICYVNNKTLKEYVITGGPSPNDVCFLELPDTELSKEFEKVEETDNGWFVGGFGESTHSWKIEPSWKVELYGEDIDHDK